MTALLGRCRKYVIALSAVIAPTIRYSTRSSNPSWQQSVSPPQCLNQLAHAHRREQTLFGQHGQNRDLPCLQERARHLAHKAHLRARHGIDHQPQEPVAIKRAQAGCRIDAAAGVIAHDRQHARIKHLDHLERRQVDQRSL